MEKVNTGPITNTAFVKILEKIEEYHKKIDKILEGTSQIEKAFILGTYVWRLKEHNDEMVKK